MKPVFDKIRWGIIGCGDVTEKKSGPAFQKVANSELVAVMRRDAKLARDYAQRHNVPNWYSKADELINDPQVDAVYIATPPSSHKEYTLAVAKARKPVYVEKPMAMNYAECQEMINTCETAKVPLFTALYRRGLPRFLKVKELIDSGSIGEVRAVNMALYKPASTQDIQGGKNWRVDPAIAGCGYFCDLAPHMIDLLIYFLGPIDSAQGHTANQGKLYDAEDLVSAMFEFESGVQGVGLWSFNANHHLDRVEIIGSKGCIKYSCFMDKPVLLNKNGKEKEFSIEHPIHIQQALIQTIVDELLGKGTCPSTGKTAAITQLVMDKILNTP
ncbi:MAG: gfo/Idh/MocA family oxidoreductase [Calditrichaeota bacterium]|nr:MAG: gfo/Idh/MocA family oxidoreductase [Calditrichota bacterium]MBL1205546.1 gfo/Idh/MocA family oxidoreductase [Calditrichota bacterium]NOG45375.1 Gfo/Idh/MocA family oxidoreductase [Calditrichota bacterium]